MSPPRERRGWIEGPLLVLSGRSRESPADSCCVRGRHLSPSGPGLPIRHPSVPLWPSAHLPVNVPRPRRLLQCVPPGGILDAVVSTGFSVGAGPGRAQTLSPKDSGGAASTTAAPGPDPWIPPEYGEQRLRSAPAVLSEVTCVCDGPAPGGQCEAMAHLRVSEG